ncbi:AAA+ ATPase domain protein [Vibrio phage 1.081.O._10N.286.52.C2]|nr:AAA+ ATPase domain protein [Vibrio phage 1.081.O._10N.286.52.C2]
MGLTNCQEGALNAFMESEGNMTISGPAGSGKTYLMKSILEALKYENVAMVAPTHQAKNVLHKMTGCEVSTIHSLLKIHPDTYEDQKHFKQAGEVEGLEDIDVLIVEEASMIDDEIYKIMGDTMPRKCRILGVGDKYQLQPVKHDPGVISPMFTRFDCFEMTEVVRQAKDNPLIQVATEVREGGWLRSNWSKERKQGVLRVPSVTKMLDTYLSKIKTPEDLMDYRILAYTNDCVDTFNGIIREHIYKTSDPFHVGEYVVTQAPVMVSGGKFPVCVIDNGEVVKILNIRQETVSGGLPVVDDEVFDVAVLTIEKDCGSVFEFTVLWDDLQKERFARYLSIAAGTYKSTRGNTKRYWRAFWALKEQMIETKSLGASTIHKSQGSTVKGVCIYTPDMGYADPELVQQLAYVGLTRPTDWALYH